METPGRSLEGSCLGEGLTTGLFFGVKCLPTVSCSKVHQCRTLAHPAAHQWLLAGVSKSQKAVLRTRSAEATSSSGSDFRP